MNFNSIRDTLISKAVSSMYVERYLSFIASCTASSDDIVYTEKHHILPKAIWPEYESFSKHQWNMAKLTGHQHFIAHWMLAKALGGAAWNAVHMMAYACSEGQDRMYRITGKQYQIIKEELAAQTSARFKGVPKTPEHRFKIAMALTGKPRLQTSQQTRDKISKSVSGELNGFYGRHHTEESKELMRAANTGRKLSPERIEAMREFATGRTHSPETRALLSSIRTGCTHTDETKQKLSEIAKQRNSNPMLGKAHSDESKAKMREAKLGKPGVELSDDAKAKIGASKIGKPRKQVTCPHCSKVGGDGMMQRWHFDNCKQKGL